MGVNALAGSYTWKLYRLQNDIDINGLVELVSAWARSRGKSISTAVSSRNKHRAVAMAFTFYRPFIEGPDGLVAFFLGPWQLKGYWHRPYFLLLVTKHEKYVKIASDAASETVEPFLQASSGQLVEKAALRFNGDPEWALAYLAKLIEKEHNTARYQEVSSKYLGNTESRASVPTSLRTVVYMGAEEERVPSATEEVAVPKGVTISVKRSRTVEHTVNVTWTNSLEAGIEVSLLKVISASILASIEQSRSEELKKSETIEYEVSLNGNESSRYLLTWADIWRSGVAEVELNGVTQFIPFKLRERAELEVSPK